MDTQKIRHRRLYAFYNSKVLNALMLIIAVCLLLLAYSESMLLPVICGTIALLFFIGYSLWLWIKKPDKIIINKKLSDITSFYVLYDLIIVAIYPVNQWLLIVPITLSVVGLAISLMSNHDEIFEI